MLKSEDGKKAFIEPIQLEYDDTFNFKCHKGLSCFTKCCRGIDIMLTPYDILRMKKCLDLSSDEFLAIYTEVKILEETDMPMVTMKLLDDEERSCPFVREEGCLIYNDRPTTCRYYPLGMASLSHKEERGQEGFFFMIKEPHCKGGEEEKSWTVREWREDQGVDIHDEINAGWTDILVRKRSFPKHVKLSEKSKQLFFMVSYNIDKFKRFVFESDFLKLYNIDKETIDKIKEDEVALLDFGFKWISSVFFKKENEESIFIVDAKSAEERMIRRKSELEAKPE